MKTEKNQNFSGDPESANLAVAGPQICDLQQHPRPTPSDSSMPPTQKPPACPDLSSARVNSIQRMTRVGATVRQLTEKQLTKLILWLHEHPVAEATRLAAAPPPDGFGINFHYTTLRRFKAKLDAGDLADKLQRLTDLCHDAAEESGELDLHNIQSVIGGLVHDYVLQAVQNTGDPYHIAKLVDSLAKLSAIDHKTQKLALDRQRLQAQIDSGIGGASLPASRHTQLQQVNLNIVPINPEEQKRSEKILPPASPSQLPGTTILHQIADNPPEPVQKNSAL